MKLVAQCKIRRQPPRQVRTNPRPRGPRHIHWTVANVESSQRVASARVARLMEVIGRLRQSPSVVLGDQAIRTVIRAAAVAAGRTRIALTVVIPVLCVVHLVVQRLGLVIPHLQQPPDPKLGLGGKVGRHGRAFAEHVVPAIITPARTLWNEIIGFVFMCFGVIFGFRAVRLYLDFSRGTAETAGADFVRFVVSAFCTLLMLYFGVTSFLRARKISRS